MNQKELKDLIEFLIEKDIAEFELERGDVKVKVIRSGRGHAVTSVPEVRYVQAAPPPSAPSVPGAAPAAQGAERASAPPAAAAEEDLFIVKSPIVGTFYESPSPGSP